MALKALMDEITEKDRDFFVREAHENAEKRASAIRKAVEHHATACEKQLDEE